MWCSDGLHHPAWTQGVAALPPPQACMDAAWDCAWLQSGAVLHARMDGSMGVTDSLDSRDRLRQ